MNPQETASILPESESEFEDPFEEISMNEYPRGNLGLLAMVSSEILQRDSLTKFSSEIPQRNSSVRLSREIIERELVPPGLDFGDDLSDRENQVQQVKSSHTFHRNPERHRTLERARRSRLKGVMDKLQTKLPERLWQEEYPNKVKRSQIDVVNLAIKYIAMLERSRSNNPLPEPDPERDTSLFVSGYRRCATDATEYSKHHQIFCTDARNIMSFIIEKSARMVGGQKSATATPSGSSFFRSKAAKRQHEGNPSTSSSPSTGTGDSLELSVFKSKKRGNISLDENSSRLYGDDTPRLPKIRRDHSGGSLLLSQTLPEQSLLLPAKSLFKVDSKSNDVSVIDVNSPPSPPPSPTEQSS